MDLQEMADKLGVDVGRLKVANSYVEAMADLSIDEKLMLMLSDTASRASKLKPKVVEEPVVEDVPVEEPVIEEVAEVVVEEAPAEEPAPVEDPVVELEEEAPADEPVVEEPEAVKHVGGSGVDEKVIEVLVEAGITTADDVLARESELVGLKYIGEKTAAKLVEWASS